MLSFQRFYKGQTRFGIFGNLTSHIDRETMGVTYVDFHLGFWRIGLAWKNRHWVDECPSVGDRGVW